MLNIFYYFILVQSMLWIVKYFFQVHLYVELYFKSNVYKNAKKSQTSNKFYLNQLILDFLENSDSVEPFESLLFLLQSRSKRWVLINVKSNKNIEDDGGISRLSKFMKVGPHNFDRQHNFFPHSSPRPTSHTIFLHTILRKKDKKIFFLQK